MSNKYEYFYQKEIEKNINKTNYSLSLYHFKSILQNYEVEVDRFDRIFIRVKNFKSEDIPSIIDLLSEYKWNIITVKGENIKDPYMQWNDVRYDIRGNKQYHYDELEMKYHDIVLKFTASYYEIKLHPKEIKQFYYTLIPGSRVWDHYYNGIDVVGNSKYYTSLKKIILYEDEYSNFNYELLRKQFRMITQPQEWKKVRIDTKLILGDYLSIYYDARINSYYTNNYLPKPSLTIL